MIESGFVFGSLETLLDSPAGTRDTDQLAQFSVGWPITDVVGDLVGIGDRAAGQQPVSASRLAPGPDVHGGPVVQSLPVGTVAAAQACQSASASSAMTAWARRWRRSIEMTMWDLGTARTWARWWSSSHIRRRPTWP